MTIKSVADWLEIADDGFVSLVGPIYRGPCTGEGHHFRFTAETKHKNRGGFVHGGMLMTFADRALAATARASDPDRLQATMQLNMHFVQPVKIGSSVEIRCRLIKETRSVSFMEGKIYVDDELVASAHGLWKIIKPSAFRQL